MFLDPPRWFGNPYQQFITSEKKLVALIESLNGLTPCYLSIYTFPTPETFIFDKIFLDLDSDDLGCAYNDCQRLIDFCETVSVPYTIVFSGKKGFHFYIHLAQSDKTMFELRALQYSLVEFLGLQSVDHHSFGNFRQMARIPTTLYISNDGRFSKYFCRYITHKDFIKGLSHIRKLARYPGTFPEHSPSDFSFDELAAYLPNYQSNSFSFCKFDFLSKYEFAKSTIGTPNVLPSCLKKELLSKKPRHLFRFEATCWLKLIGFTNNTITDFYESLEWEDFCKEKTAYQVRRIYGRLPMCRKLRQLNDQNYCKACIIGR